jgi:hypothetical protein
MVVVEFCGAIVKEDDTEVDVVLAVFSVDDRVLLVLDS